MYLWAILISMGKIVSMFGSNLGKDKNSANKIFKYMMMSQMMNGAAGTGTGTDSNPMSAMMTIYDDEW